MPRRDGPSTESQVVEELVRRAADGDPEAQAILIRKYWSLIAAIINARWTAAGRVLVARHEPDDLIQSAALRLLESLPRHRWRHRGAFIAWISAIASSDFSDVLRRQRAARRDAGMDAGSDELAALRQPQRSAESIYDRNEEVAQLERLMQTIEPEYACAIQLHAMGFSHAEIGEALGRSDEAARKLVARASAKLLRLRKKS
jgi:RNA polymerase sigma factor (sigma-70 family)